MLTLNLSHTWMGVAALSLSLVATGRLYNAAKGVTVDSSESRTARPAQVEHRTIHFRTNQSTWMSLDVSPDGKTIVFDLLGDLYVLPVTGGKARPITSGAAFDTQPRFSPDGRRLAYVSDKDGAPNLWVADNEGRNPRRLSTHHNLAFSSTVCSPTWSPNGRTIVVSQRIGATSAEGSDSRDNFWYKLRWALASYDVDSGEMRWLSDTSYSRGRGTLGPVFSPDGVSIYAAVEAYRTGHSALNTWRIYRIDPNNGMTTPEMPADEGRDGLRPMVSPDGQYLVYVSSTGSRHGLRLRNLSTGHEAWLLRERIDIAGQSLGHVDSRDLAPGYAFTPDAKAVIVALDGQIRRIRLIDGRVSTVPFVADVRRQLAPMTVHQFAYPDTAVRTRSVMQPAISPDGQSVAFVALNRIWMMNLPHEGRPAGMPYRLTSDSIGEFYPSWSPDGAWIAYSSFEETRGGAVRRAQVRPAGGVLSQPSRRLTSDTALYFHTAVSGDGRRVFAVRAPLPHERVPTHLVGRSHLSGVTLSSVPAAGGSIRTLLSLQDHGESYSSRLPVDQLYLSHDARANLGLVSIELENARPQEELIFPKEMISRPFTDISGVLSPDRQRALVTYRSSLFELTLPAGAKGRTKMQDLNAALHRPFGSRHGAARRWGAALTPWISWSRDGRRVLFSQGGSFFLGDLQSGSWTTFVRVDVPLMIPPDMPVGSLVFRGARIITMRNKAGNRPDIIERGDLIIKENRIRALGRSGTIELPADAQVWDLSGKTILPGYVDVHDHLSSTYGDFSAQCWRCLVRLAGGITALRDPEGLAQTYNDVFALAERVQTGEVIGPRIFSTGVPHFGGDRPIRNLEDARAVIRPYSDSRSETFKEYDSRASRRARQFIAGAAQELGFNATIHVNGIAHGLSAFTDGFTGVEHVLSSSAPLYDDVLTFIALSGSTYTMTYGPVVRAREYMLGAPRVASDLARLQRFVPPSAREAWAPIQLIRQVGKTDVNNLERIISSAAAIVLRGGKVAMSSHGDIGGYSFHYEMWLHALGGEPHYEILRSATIVGAEAIGHAKDLGSLEAGKLADIQILNEDPLMDIHNTMSVAYVMKNGRLYRTDDLKEVWPRNRPLAPTYLYAD